MKLLITQNHKQSWIDLPTNRIDDFEIIGFESKVKLIEPIIINAKIIDLNHLAIILNDLKEVDIKKLNILLTYSENINTIYDLLNLALYLDNYEVLEGITDYYSLGQYYIDNYPSYHDPEELGKDLYKEENGLFIDNYYISSPTYDHHY